MATIKDIAKRLNVSVSTVSYALNGGPRTVPDAVRERVLQTARELEYRPNRIARSLATGRSHTIGVVPTEPIRDLASMNFFHAVFTGVVNAAEELAQDVVVVTRANAARGEGLDDLMDGRADGLILLSPRRPDVLQKLAEAGVPFVGIAAAHDGEFPNFGCDNVAGVDLAVDHLVALGHRRIGHLTGQLDMHDGAERLRAFRAALARHGLPVREDWIEPAGFTIDGGEAAAGRVFAGGDGPTALFAANDESAFGALKWAAANGVAVPRDLSIVGFDDAGFASYLTPGLTTVRQPFAQMGADAVRAVVDLVEGRLPASRSYPPQFVLRASTAPLSKEGIL